MPNPKWTRFKQTCSCFGPVQCYEKWLFMRCFFPKVFVFCFDICILSFHSMYWRLAFGVNVAAVGQNKSQNAGSPQWWIHIIMRGKGFDEYGVSMVQKWRLCQSNQSDQVILSNLFTFSLAIFIRFTVAEFRCQISPEMKKAIADEQYWWKASFYALKKWFSNIVSMHFTHVQQINRLHVSFVSKVWSNEKYHQIAPKSDHHLSIL